MCVCGHLPFFTSGITHSLSRTHPCMTPRLCFSQGTAGQPCECSVTCNRGLDASAGKLGDKAPVCCENHGEILNFDGIVIGKSLKSLMYPNV